jgi:glucokinase
MYPKILTMFLAGDIGGTNTRVAIFEGDPNHLTPIIIDVYPSRDHAGLSEIARDFLSKHKTALKAAAFGIAGPIRNNRCETSNLPWIIDGAELAAELGVARVTLINDLEANAHGIAVLQETDFAVVNAGAADAAGNRALIAAGTGLGEAGLFAEPGGYRPIASEGGHADFAPRNETEIEMLRYLAAQFGHVSYERVLSGPGLYNIYRFLRDTGRAAEPAWLAEEIASHDPSACIAKSALQGKAEISVQALDIFISVYGAEAGNLGLEFMAVGGVFIGGGIAPKIASKLTGTTFMQSFTAKGRMGRLLEAVPVRIIMNDKTALLGAARVAALSAVASSGSETIAAGVNR